ncbi:MAG: PilZ domain-containing protein [Pseudomonadales bacterium]|nr:PilZ domain-containing protein [Pseudomonadales bacterium]
MPENNDESMSQGEPEAMPETTPGKIHSADQRGATRYPAEGELTLSLNGGEVNYQGQLKDVSDSGVFVRMGTPPPDTFVDSNGEMKLISHVDGHLLEIVGDVRVIRVTARGVGLYINAIQKQARMDFVKLMIHVRYNNS